MKTLIVNEKFNEKKLNTYLMHEFPSLSMNTIYKALRKKDIKINKKRVSENQIIFTNDQIDVYITDDLLYAQANINIIYEDSNIVIVNKSSNLEVTGENSLTTLLSNQLACNVYPCHRLDRNTTRSCSFCKKRRCFINFIRKI